MTYISVLFQLRARLSSLFWFFFFKQKTAYEMRISDWSSDVCSSDLYRRKRYGCGGVGGWRRERRRDPEHQPRERRRHQVRQAAREQRLQAELGDHRALVRGENGRASCRERVCQYVYSSVGAASLQKK